MITGERARDSFIVWANRLTGSYFAVSYVMKTLWYISTVSVFYMQRCRDLGKRYKPSDGQKIVVTYSDKYKECKHPG